jgi:hypothetical protein
LSEWRPARRSAAVAAGASEVLQIFGFEAISIHIIWAFVFIIHLFRLP